MKFEIKKTKLSQKCRDSIKLSFKSTRLSMVRLDDLMDQIDMILPIFIDHQESHRDSKAAINKRIKKDLCDFWRALENIHPKTRRILQFDYHASYPVPEPYEANETNRFSACLPDGTVTVSHVDPRILKQTKSTHLMRLDSSGIDCCVVGFDELVERLTGTCERVAETWHPNKGRPSDPRINFVRRLALIYHFYTGRVASKSEGTAFPELVGLVLEDVTGENSGKDRHKLIATALKFMR